MPEILDISIGYIAIGALVIVANLLILVTLLSSGKLIAKYQMLIALAFADIISGCGAIGAGYSRLTLFAPNASLRNTTVSPYLQM